MNKTLLLESLARLEQRRQQDGNEIESIKAQLEEPERVGLWRPEIGGPFASVDPSGDRLYLRCTNKSDQEVVEFSAVFKGITTATRATPSLRRANKIIQAGYEADADAGEFVEGDRMHYAMTEHGRWIPNEQCKMYAGHSLVYVHTREQARHMAAILNAEGVK